MSAFHNYSTSITPLQVDRTPEKFSVNYNKESSTLTHKYEVVNLDESACADKIYTMGKSCIVIFTKRNIFLFDGSDSREKLSKLSVKSKILNLIPTQKETSTIVTTVNQIGLLNLCGKDVSSIDNIEVIEELDYLIHSWFEPIIDGSKLYLVGEEKNAKKNSLPFIACVDISTKKSENKTLWKSPLVDNGDIKVIKFPNHIVVVLNKFLIKICSEKGTQEKIHLGLSNIVAASKISNNQLCLYNVSHAEKRCVILNIETKELKKHSIPDVPFNGITFHGTHFSDQSWILAGTLYSEKKGTYSRTHYPLGLYNSQSGYVKVLSDNINRMIYSTFDKNGTLIALTGPSMEHFATYSPFSKDLGYTLHFFDKQGKKVIDSFDLTKNFPEVTFCSGFTVTSEGKIALVGAKVTSYRIESLFDSDTDSDRYFAGKYECGLYILPVYDRIPAK